jgi:hypothetical protein
MSSESDQLGLSESEAAASGIYSPSNSSIKESALACLMETIPSSVSPQAAAAGCAASTAPPSAAQVPVAPAATNDVPEKGPIVFPRRVRQNKQKSA